MSDYVSPNLKDNLMVTLRAMLHEVERGGSDARPEIVVRFPDYETEYILRGEFDLKIERDLVTRGSTVEALPGYVWRITGQGIDFELVVT